MADRAEGGRPAQLRERRRRKGLARVATAAVAAWVPLASAVTVAVVGMGAAPAAATGPLDCSVPTDYLALGNGPNADINLYASQEGPGAPTFSVVGSSSAAYNAMGISPSDGYLYGISLTNDHLVSVGSGATATDVGPITNLPAYSGAWATGAFDPSGTLWVVNEQHQNLAYGIDVQGPGAPAVVQTLTLSSPLLGIDWSYDYSHFWALDGNTLSEVDPGTGTITTRSLSGVPSDSFNAAWTYANGDLGFQDSSYPISVRISGVNTAFPHAVVYNYNQPHYSEGDGASCRPPLSFGSSQSGSSLPDGTYGSSYSQTVSVSGGQAPYQFTLTGGSLPPGLTLGPDGTVSGTPTSAGTYTFTVRATDSSGFPDSGSTTVTITIDPAPLMITASGGSMTYGGSVPAVTPSYSGFVGTDGPSALSTLPACGTAATSSSPVGPYATSCSGAAADNYTISYTDGTLTVTPAALTVTASSGAMTYGGTVPAVTASYAGFQNGDSEASLSSAPACGTSATSSSPVGDYPTSCSGAVDPNYTFNYVDGNMSVGQAALVITASSPTMTYGGSVPAVSASYSGFVNGDSSASLASQPTCGTSASSSSGVGVYPTGCSGAADPNYNISYVAGSLTVDPAPLTITASSGSMTVGSTPPAVTPSYAGFVNGDTASSLTTQPTCSTTATSSSGPGTYPTTCSGASDPNYQISYVAGTMTVQVNRLCPNDQLYGTGPNLSGQNLSGQNLSGVNLAGADLSGANLSGTNLSGADLEGANLSGAILSGTNLRGADLRGANLFRTGGSGVNLSGADLTCANLYGAPLKGDNLQGANLTRAELASANVQGANLSSANLTGADLSGAHLSGVNVNRATWSNTTCPDGTNSDSPSDGGTCQGHLS